MKRVGARVLTMLLACVHGRGMEATTEFRSPISLERGQLHYPLPHVRNTWWYDVLNFDPDCSQPPCWYIEGWTGYYNRSANKAYFDPCGNHVTRHTEPLSSIFFGQTSFTVVDTFPGTTIPCNSNPVNNPFVRFALISPHISYTENGVFFGLWVERRLGCENRWRVGGRVSMPFVVIGVGQSDCCENIQETLNDVAAEAPLDLATAPNAYTYDFAYRLDFLSCLIRPDLPISDSLPLWIYGNGTTDIPTQAAGTPASAVPGTVDGFDTPPIFVIKRADGTIPPRNPFWAQTQAGVNPLAADGSGADNGVYYFNTLTDYAASSLGNDASVQREFFVVPHFYDDMSQISDGSVGFRSAVDAILDVLNIGQQSAVGFLQSCGIDLTRYDRFRALGDLFTEIYGGYGDCDFGWFVDGIFGVRFPTGTKMKNPLDVYWQSTGHNRHFEIKLGVEGGWQPYDWFAFKIDFFYNHALKRKNQKIAAPFAGAVTKNIGPTVDAKISWNYVVLHVDFTLFHPCNPELGCTFGYELFAKGKDKVSLCETTAVTCTGVEAALDPCVYSTRTNALTNKLRAEVFHRWNMFELFAGGSQVIAGRNAMRETEIHLGLAAYF